MTLHEAVTPGITFSKDNPYPHPEDASPNNRGALAILWEKGCHDCGQPFTYADLISSCFSQDYKYDFGFHNGFCYESHRALTGQPCHDDQTAATYRFRSMNEET